MVEQETARIHSAKPRYGEEADCPNLVNNNWPSPLGFA